MEKLCSCSQAKNERLSNELSAEMGLPNDSINIRCRQIELNTLILIQFRKSRRILH